MNRRFSKIKSKFGGIDEISFVQMRVEVNVILVILFFQQKTLPINGSVCVFSLDLEIQKQFRIHRRIVLVNFIVKMRSG